MAGVHGIAQTDQVATVVGTRTVLQIVAAANHRVLIKEFSVSFQGTSNTATPAEVRLARQTDAGTSTELTPEKVNEGDNETLQTTARHTATMEPTTGNTIMHEHVHTQAGYTWQAPFGGEIVVIGGNRLGIVIEAAAVVNVVARFKFEE